MNAFDSEGTKNKNRKAFAQPLRVPSNACDDGQDLLAKVVITALICGFEVMMAEKIEKRMKENLAGVFICGFEVMMAEERRRRRRRRREKMMKDLVGFFKVVVILLVVVAFLVWAQSSGTCSV